MGAMARPDAPVSDLEYAGFWLRVGAAAIDSALVAVIIVPLMWWAYGERYFLGPDPLMGPADVLIRYVLPAVLVIAFWLYKLATPGKMAISATIVDARTGRRPSAGQLVIRYFGYFVSTLPLGLGLIWVAFDSRKQGWHDKLAGTVVVRRGSGGGVPVVFEDAPR